VRHRRPDLEVKIVRGEITGGVFEACAPRDTGNAVAVMSAYPNMNTAVPPGLDS